MKGTQLNEIYKPDSELVQLLMTCGWENITASCFNFSSHIAMRQRSPDSFKNFKLKHAFRKGNKSIIFDYGFLSLVFQGVYIFDGLPELSRDQLTLILFNENIDILRREFKGICQKVA